MDKGIEAEFVCSCIRREYRERLLFELQSQKHRPKALSRFAHDCQSILQSGYRVFGTGELESLITASAQTQGYLISDGQGDGMTLPVAKAMDTLHQAYLATILITPHFTVIKPEAEGGKQVFYLFEK
ncbi:MAG: hypothetical protein E7581_04310 [Ruminococcaceae bacterium]|nr:hypothetical protein [Oscillospiraceae bacterium]